MSPRPHSWPVRVLRGFVMFWWDFLVGDTPEIFVAALVIIAVIALLSQVGHRNGAAVILLPLMAIAALAGSLERARRRARRD